MGSETADPVTISTRSSPGKKNLGKVPRKIHKAEREKLKRDHMNGLFLDFSKTLDLDQPNNGKASVLRNTIRLLGELLSQVDNLKKENAALSSESNYEILVKVGSSPNLLKPIPTTSALDAEIKRLQREIDERANCSNLDVSRAQQPEDHVAIPLVPHAPELGPVFVLPLQHEPQGVLTPYSEANIAAKIPSSISKPQARYRSSSDSWPTRILTKIDNV